MTTPLGETPLVTPRRRARTIRHLRELVIALDSRHPQMARAAETQIAAQAAALRAAALARIAAIEREQDLSPSVTTISSMERAI